MKSNALCALCQVRYNRPGKPVPLKTAGTCWRVVSGPPRRLVKMTDTATAGIQHARNLIEYAPSLRIVDIIDSLP